MSQGIDSLESYLKARRVGRGTPLNRGQKAQVWSVVSAFRDDLVRRQALDPAGAIALTRDLISSLSPQGLYASVLVDETQDFGENALRLIRALAGPQRDNDLFLVGDAHQRIYGQKVILSHCGIDTTGRREILRVDYRTTVEIGRFARSLLKNMSMDDLENGLQDPQGSISLRHGSPPLIRNWPTQTEAWDSAVAQIRSWLDEGHPPKAICVTARLNQQIDQIKQQLNRCGIPTYEVKPSRHDERSIQGVRLATMHRIKGLEFDCVLITGANRDILPLKSLLENAVDPLDVRDRTLAEQQLLYVAATRARKELAIHSWGEPSLFLCQAGAPASSDQDPSRPSAAE